MSESYDLDKEMRAVSRDEEERCTQKLLEPHCYKNGLVKGLLITKKCDRHINELFENPFYAWLCKLPDWAYNFLYPVFEIKYPNYYMIVNDKGTCTYYKNGKWMPIYKDEDDLLLQRAKILRKHCYRRGLYQGGLIFKERDNKLQREFGYRKFDLFLCKIEDLYYNIISPIYYYFWPHDKK